MFRNRSLAFKLILFFSGGTAIIFLLIFSVNYTFSKKLIMRYVEENARNFTQSMVNRIETVLRSVKKIPEHIAFFLEEGDLSMEQMIKMMRLVAANNEEIYGIGIGYEPYAFDKEQLYFAPYYFKEDGQLKLLDNMGSPTYRYFYLDWYQIPRELNQPIWTEPYFDDTLMTTYSTPFYKNIGAERELTGIICADISLEWLTKMIGSIKVLKTGDAYLISKNGTIITHNVKELIMNESIFSVAEDRADAAMRKIGRSMVKGESGFVPFKSIARGKQCWMYYAPVPTTGWSLAVLFPEDELLEDVHRLNRIVGILGLCGMALLLGVIVVISHTITGRLRLMAKAAQAIGSGNLDAPIPVAASGDEVGKLAEAFRYMQASLKEYIRKLMETTAAKERIESELKIAREIQTSMLPRIFPPFPHKKEFDIFATMEPAKEVGGDFYDFFLINENKLCLIMGDVSGKGVPAALFMMITKILLKNAGLQDLPADRILSRANDIIALDNDASMFATVFCAILDIETGEVEFANAGHNPPLICRSGAGVEFLEIGKSFVLGPMQGYKFTSRRLKLNPGDIIFLYTDGVTEAMNTKKELFSEGRLKEVLTRLKEKSITDIIKALRQEIAGFAQGEPQSDDITMLVVKYNSR
jgi:sigma-B regulation protein RsbU (phosphoserine phosphatase)